MKRDRSAVKRDIDDLEKAGLVSVVEKASPGHGRLKEVCAVADKQTVLLEQHKHLYFTMDTPSVNTVPPLVKGQAAQVVNVQAVPTGAKPSVKFIFEARESC